MQGKLLTALIALALAAPVFAQDKTNTAQSSDNATRSEVDNQSNSTRNNQQSSNDPNVPTRNSSSSMNQMSGGNFEMMDKSHHGYLMPKDVASDKKISANFKNCDKNHDGRLSREEYDSCSGGM